MCSCGSTRFAWHCTTARCRFRWGHAEVGFDHPGKLTPDAEDDAFLLVDRADAWFERIDKEFILLAAYFVPTEDKMALFKSLRERGVRVRMLTNSLASTDVAAVHAGYARHRKDLLRMGVELYEFNRRWERHDGRPSGRLVSACLFPSALPGRLEG